MAQNTTSAIGGRITSADGKPVPPDEFIAEAEKAGVIASITRYVIDMVLADLPELLKARPGFHVSLNLSPQDLVADGPVQYLQRRFSAMEFPAGALMLEVTERGLVDIEAARPAQARGDDAGDARREARRLGAASAAVPRAGDSPVLRRPLR